MRYLFYTMDFEFDPKTSESNLKRYGIDFINAQEIWLDLDRVEVPAKTTDENRSMVIGKI